MQTAKAGKQAGLSKQIEPSIQFIQTLLNNEIGSMLRVGKKGWPTEDELAARVLKYDIGAVKKGLAPQKLATTLRMTTASNIFKK